MRTYLALMHPEEPYTFSNDRKSAFQKNDEERTGKESYFIDSNVLPEQTTIWGMMRLLIIEQAGLVNSFFDYDDETTKKIHELIGEKSFNFQSNTEQDFGKLKSISPVFLCEYENKDQVQYIVKNPACNTVEDGFVPYKMKKSGVMTDYGDVSLPTNYNAKNGTASGYINLSTGKVYCEDDLFTKYVQAGNHKNENGQLMKKDKKDGAFFRRTKYCLNNQDTWKRGIAFFVTVDDDIELKNDLVTIGAGKNVFSVTFVEKENDLEDKVTELGKENSSKWGYALSDIVLSEVPSYENFSIVSIRSMRNLSTKGYKEKCHYHERFDRKGNRTMMVNRGSVFFEDYLRPKENPNLEKLGYNQIVTIGG